MLQNTLTSLIQSKLHLQLTVIRLLSLAYRRLENWTFKYYEDLFAQDAGTPVVVNVTSKAYRHVALYNPGNYTATLTYYNGTTTKTNWVVRQPSGKRAAKNVILFIGDGMTQSMITAARLIAHKSINGEYQSLMQLDQMEALGHQMTHSIDSFITDSANSATALYTGKKSTVNALNVYVDSSPDPFDDPKVSLSLHDSVAWQILTGLLTTVRDSRRTCSQSQWRQSRHCLNSLPCRCNSSSPSSVSCPYAFHCSLLTSAYVLLAILA